MPCTWHWLLNRFGLRDRDWDADGPATRAVALLSQKSSRAPRSRRARSRRLSRSRPQPPPRSTSTRSTRALARAPANASTTRTSTRRPPRSTRAPKQRRRPTLRRFAPRALGFSSLPEPLRVLSVCRSREHRVARAAAAWPIPAAIRSLVDCRSPLCESANSHVLIVQCSLRVRLQCFFFRVFPALPRLNFSFEELVVHKYS